MKLTGCEFCQVVEGLEIFKVKLLKLDVKTLETVKFSSKLTVADKRNIAALDKREHGSIMAHQSKGVNRAFESF